MSIILLGFVAAVGFAIWRDGSSRTGSSLFKAPPPDVVAVMQEFDYREELPYATLSVKGRRGVQRGKRMLGLRTSVVKVTSFDQLEGRLIVPTGELLRFSAAEAVWELNRNAPLELLKQVSIDLRGVKLPKVQRALLYPREGLLVVYGDQRRTYQLH